MSSTGIMKKGNPYNLDKSLVRHHLIIHRNICPIIKIKGQSIYDGKGALT